MAIDFNELESFSVGVENELDYSQTASPNKLLSDPRFLKDLKDYYQHNGLDFESDEEMMKDWYSDSAWADMNSWVAVKGDMGYLAAKNASPEQKARMGRLSRTFNRIPTTGEGGTADTFGWGSVLGENIGAAVLDPLNVVGGFAGGAVAKQAIGQAGKALNKYQAKEAIKQGAKYGAVAEGIASVPVEMAVDGALQARDMETGIQDEYSIGRTIGAGAVGAVAGSGMGAAFGALGSALASRGLTKMDKSTTQYLEDRGFTQEDFLALNEEQWNEALDDHYKFANQYLAERDQLNLESTVDDVDASTPNSATEATANPDTDDIDLSDVAETQVADVPVEASSRLVDIEQSLEDFNGEITEADGAIIDQLLAERDIINAMKDGDPEAVKAWDEVQAGRDAVEASQTLTPKEKAPEPEPEINAEAEAEVKETTAINKDTPAINAENIYEDAEVINMFGNQSVGYMLDSGITPEQIKKSKQPLRLMKKAADQAGIQYKKSANLDDLKTVMSAPRVLIDGIAEAQPTFIKGSEEYRASLPEMSEQQWNVTKTGLYEEYLRMIAKSVGVDMPSEKFLGITAKTLKSKDPKLGEGANYKFTEEDFIKAAARVSELSKAKAKPNPRDVQEFMRPTKTLGASDANSPGYSVSRSVETPRQSLMGLEAAQAQAELKGEMNPIPYKATGRQAVSGSTKFVRKNTKVWYDPVTKKSWADFEEMLAARGETGAGKTPTIDGEVTSRAKKSRQETELKRVNERRAKDPDGALPPLTPEEYFGKTQATETQSLDEISRGRFGFTPDELAAALKEMQAGNKNALDNLVVDKQIETMEATAQKQRKTAQQQAPTTAKPSKPLQVGTSRNPAPDYVPAIMAVSGEYAGTARGIRVMTPKQMAEGKTLSDLLGKQDPKNWATGVVPKGTRAGKSALNKMVIDQEGVELKSTGETAAKPQRIIDEDAPEITQIGKHNPREIAVKISDLTDKEREALDLVVAIKGNEYPAINKIISEGMLSHDAISKFISVVETANWADLEGFNMIAKSKNRLLVVRSTLARLYDLQSRVSPGGVIKPVASRVDAIKAVNKIFSKQSPDEIAAASDFINRINDAHGFAPIINQGQSAGAGGRFDPNQNTITMGDNNVMPKPIVLFHETAHWAYENILTPKDKADFWKWIEKNHSDAGRAGDADAIRADNPTYAASDYKYTDEVFSPQETFANMFMRYTTDVMSGKNPILADEGMWKRVTRYIKAIFDSFMGQKIPNDMERIFAKILPNDDAVSAGLADGSGKVIIDGVERNTADIYKVTDAPQPLKRMGRNIMSRWLELDGIEDQINRSILDDDISPEPANNLATYLYSIGTKQGNVNAKKVEDYRGKTGAFSPVLDMSRVITDTAREINKIVGRAYSSLDSETGTVVNASDQIQAEWLDFYHNGNEELPPVKETLKGIKQRYGQRYFKTEGIRLTEGITSFFNLDYGNAIDPDMWKTIKDKLDRSGATAALKAENKAQYNAQNPNKVEKVSPEKLNDGAKKAVKTAKVKSIRTTSYEDLVDYIDKAKGTELEIEASKELIRKIQAEPLQAEPVAIRRELIPMRVDELQNELTHAITESDSELVNEIVYELQRRSHNKKNKDNKVKAFFKVKNSYIADAISAEENFTKGGELEPDIPANLPALQHEFLRAMTHRNPQAQSVMRTMSARMFNLMGDSKKILSDEELSNLAGVNQANDGANSTLAGPGSYAFNEMRNRLRKMAVGLTSGKTDPMDVMRDVGSTLVNTNLFTDAEYSDLLTFYRSVNDPSKTMIENKFADANDMRKAKEWLVEGFTQYASENAARKDIEGVRLLDDLGTRGNIGDMLDRLVEGSAYLTNGLIARNDVKAKYRRLSYYGNMFNVRSKVPEPNNTTTLPDAAREVAGLKLDNFSPVARKNLKSHVKNSISDRDGAVKIFYARNEGNRVILDESPSIKSEDNIITNTVRNINRTRMELSYIKGEIDLAKPAPYLKTMRDDYLNDKSLINHAEVKAAQLNRLLTELDYHSGKSTTPVGQITPVVATAKSTYPANASSKFDLLMSGDVIDNMRITLQNRHGIEQDVFEAIIPAIKNLDGMPANEATDQIVAIFAKASRQSATGSPLNDAAVRKIMDDAIIKSGYDNIQTDNGFVLFDKNKTTDLDESNFLDTLDPEVDAPVGKLMLNHMNMAVIREGQPGDGKHFNAISAIMDAKGVRPKMTAALRSIAKRRALRPEEIEEINKHTPRGFLKANSEEMRAQGFTWLADFIKPKDGVGHYERVQNHFSKRVIPLMKSLNNLPDAGGSIKRWGQQGVLQSQPDSHKRILKALRRPSGNSIEQRLSTQEREVYNQIRSSFVNELEELKGNGVIMGEIQDYFPQVWDTKKIDDNIPLFKANLVKYLKHEALEARGEEFATERAEEIADGVVRKLLNEDGIYMGGTTNKGNTHFENADFSRMFRYDKYPELLGDMESFMADNLTDQVVKYFDQSSLRIDFTSNFGFQNEAMNDYFNVVDGGIMAAARVLSGNRQHTAKRKSVNKDNGEIEQVIYNDGNFQSPFKSEEMAMQALNRLTPAIYNGQKDQAKRLLRELVPEDLYWERKVEGIVEALAAFKGKPNPVKADVRAHAEKSINVVMNKPVNPDASAFHWKTNASKVLRNINAISLLSYTTLTSLTDLALPLIKSGSFQSWAKGMYKYGADPDYRDSIRNIGTAIESLVHQRLTNLHGTDASKVTASFFNATMLTPWTDFNKNLAASVGVEAFHAEQKKFFKYKDKADPASKAKAALSKRRLVRYGLGQYINPENGDIKQSLDADDVRMAIIRFTNETIFSPNNNDIPLWAQSPFGRVVFQLKSFPLMMQRMVTDTFAGEGSLNSKAGGIGLFLTAAPIIAGGALATKDVLQSRGGDDNQSAQTRERSLTNLATAFGYEGDVGKSIGATADEMGGWYVESLIHMGGLGLLADVLYSSAAQLDNGSYGYNRVASTFLGPTYGLGADGFNVLSGAISGDADGNAKERSGTRSIVGRIPFIGGNAAVKESLVDYFSGEKTGKKKSDSWGSDW